MKQFYYILLIFSSLFSSTIYAQNIQFDLRCSADGNSYEIYVSRDVTTNPVLFAGSSTITLVLPTGNTRTVSHTSESVSTYNAVTAIINGNNTGNDYYAFNTSGGSSIASILTANTPVLWLTLTPSDGTDQDARLFINGTDPSNISGVNVSNVFSTLSGIGIVDEYSSNLSDIPIHCSTLSTDTVIANATISIFPNPTRDFLNISGIAVNQIKQLIVYDLNGRMVLQSAATDRLDISRLNDGAYFLEIHAKSSKHIKKLIKQ